MTNKRIEDSIQSLRDEVLILRHPPGSVRRAIEIDLIADRKRDEAAKAQRKVQKASKPAVRTPVVPTTEERSPYTVAQARELRRGYAGQREDRIFSGTLKIKR